MDSENDIGQNLTHTNPKKYSNVQQMYTKRDVNRYKIQNMKLVQSFEKHE